MMQAQGSTRYLVTEDHSMQSDTATLALASALALALAGLIGLAAWAILSI